MPDIFYFSVWMHILFDNMVHSLLFTKMQIMPYIYQFAFSLHRWVSKNFNTYLKNWGKLKYLLGLKMDVPYRILLTTVETLTGVNPQLCRIQQSKKPNIQPPRLTAYNHKKHFRWRSFLSIPIWKKMIV